MVICLFSNTCAYLVRGGDTMMTVKERIRMTELCSWGDGTLDVEGKDHNDSVPIK